jgi:hypothetical protein
MNTKDDIKKLIVKNKKKIASPDLASALASNPEMLEEMKENDLKTIREFVKTLRSWRKELFPYVKKIKTYIKDINEETFIIAAYLLLISNFYMWEAIFLLAEEGHYSAIMNLIRNIKESSMLVQLFCIEYIERKDANLKKWFSGEIIPHRKGRKSFNKLSRKDGRYPDLDHKSLQSYIYSLESMHTHNSYVGILEMINPAYKDFDFKGYAQYYRTTSALRYASGSMTDINLSIKLIWRFLDKTNKTSEEIDKILLKYDPHMDTDEISKDVLSKFKKT